MYLQWHSYLLLFFRSKYVHINLYLWRKEPCSALMPLFQEWSFLWARNILNTWHSFKGPIRKTRDFYIVFSCKRLGKFTVELCIYRVKSVVTNSWTVNMYKIYKIFLTSNWLYRHCHMWRHLLHKQGQKSRYRHSSQHMDRGHHKR